MMSTTFEQSLEKYADVCVRVGVGLEKGQRLMVRASVEAAPLVRQVAAAAYRAGARMVEIIWADDMVDLARFQFAPRDSFEELPTGLLDAMLKAGERHDGFLAIAAANPTLLKDQDPELVAKAEKARQIYLLPFSRKVTGKQLNWCVAAAAIPSWAAQVFPGMPADASMAKLWQEIFTTCRVDRPDPVAAWAAHTADLDRRCEYLHSKRFAALRFRGPGTDLTVGMPDEHRWVGGRTETTGSKIPFVANLPTEEVFSMPHKDRVDGVVRASKPLSYGGKLVEGFELRFERGKVTSVRAE
jgi:aminopeptidase